MLSGVVKYMTRLIFSISILVEAVITCTSNWPQHCKVEIPVRESQFEDSVMI